MHEYRRFIQEHLDSRGWKQADLVRASGLSRQLISSIVKDDREHLGQMPDDSTMEGIAKGFGVPVERVRTAAARSLAGYSDDGSALTLSLQDVHIDVLLNEIRRRVDVAHLAVHSSTPSGASGQAPEIKEARSTDKPEDPAARLRRHQDAFRDQVHGDQNRADEGA
ncbi:helix-turn-helix domain-containing protein [Mycolicibacterium fortuitum]|uniref:Helix-turn-helix transcriptional regulator n=1 Tax=Mycolicibacterium fortuitum TaxID=1766 RepID=A0AAE4V7S1_MYCFO|nr:helix-turn-helix transcriptional regulator [Mycolicibacterium fortuitum]MDV7194656.1 helix-turn-helix transcriptional regulator [Mycolicibacterium fortuitum]MDV7208655.1 helix-turn-helix transcriptional regulator [Mycolicibacterium fortuitum]MDV7230552.1 helix-turn-helix transcriptional regulator [Mycolicibacterium fortuitum]MDV7261841.1 helix-turn-helix transcriptional regulator [Mycolicibacterium fortuitum]MDV7287049.1 helix-turn-helix transcriptional regulator [Mycolicibacterium fortuitu